MIATPLSGAQKTAVMVLLLDEPEAAGLLGRLKADQVRAVGEAMLSVADIDPASVDAVLEEFLERTQGVAALDAQGRQLRSVLSRSLGKPRAARVIGRLGPPAAPRRFAGFDWLDAATIAHLLQGEHPQAAAAVLANLDAALAAGVLDALPDALRTDLVFRLARLGTVDPELLSELEEDLEARLAELTPSAPVAVAGADFAAKLINLSANQKALLEGLEERDANLAKLIADQLVVFADVLQLDARALQQVVREVDAETLAVALKGADEATRAKVYAAMSSRAAAQLQDDLAARGPLKRDEVDAAQSRVAAIVRQLGESGAIMLPGAGANYV